MESSNGTAPHADTPDIANGLNIPRSRKPRLVVIGGGFGGIHLLKELYQHRFQIVLFDRHNYHTFQPLLYQVATAGLEADSIAGPLRKLFEPSKDFFFRWGTVYRVVPEENKIETSLGELEYDLLVIANGTKVNYFGKDEELKKAFPLKQIPQALNFRSHMLQCLEKATMAEPEERQRLLNFVIVGGGPTGVELAGALSELKTHVLPNDYDELDFSSMNIYLVEGLPRLLNGMSDKAGRLALDYLKELDVHVMLEKLVSAYDGDVVKLSDETEIPAKTVIWAAGVTGNLVDGLPKEAIEKGNRLKVDQFSRVKGYGNIYAIGDIALMQTEKFPKGHPQLAPVAIQQGEHLAKNLNRMVTGRPMTPFSYFDKGSMATIGRNRAVADLPGDIHIGGFPAWMAWMGVHLIFLVGFRNKLITLTNWIYNYFTYDRSTRLIIRPSEKNPAFLPQENPEEEPTQADY
ncbi:NADH dehydrogenase [Catalinimonas alkaloidigena]|uniref:NADH:ubiquinone reductase (non-electrogenic) n=1 Tax=Catalinimonas alkaloidigena TaxID=1075417 RepID=A0A1G9DFT1_9BACT|nr:NAD(P)/FAD-dependent oxidoreductase [Catalinimonas alkaloidigena]SDK62700.1 NADH dehydrogenase [Catalinimonas alkaloidigena]